MAYIDREALIKKIFPCDVVDKKCYTINAKAIYEEIKKAPTEDVVPKEENEQLKQAKQEVAMEIFDVLDKKKRYLMKSNNYNLFKASIDFFDHIDDFVGLTGEEILAELEKKYIGE